MAGNTRTNTQLMCDNTRVIQHVCIDSDGTEETNLVIYDSSAVATSLKKADSLHCSILSINYSTNAAAGVVHLNFDATTPVLAWAMPYQGSGHFCFDKHNGLKNTGGTGKTGDITLTTTGLAAGDKVTLVIEVRPY